MIRLSPARARPLPAPATASAGLATAGLEKAAPAAGERAPLPLHSGRSGSLPPRCAWSLDARIAADGPLRAEHRTGDGPPGGACREAAALPAATVAAILQAARGSDLPPVGGPVRRDSLRRGRGEGRRPGFPAAEDAGRVAAVPDLPAEAGAGAVRFEGDPAG